MSTSFRPVVTETATSSATFVDPDYLELILTGLVDLSFAGECSSVTNGKEITFWVEEGQKLFDYIEQKDVRFLVSQGDADDSDIEKMTSLFENIKSMIPGWSTWIQSDGSLTFSIDTY